jgi:hypothetical protein
MKKFMCLLMLAVGLVVLTPVAVDAKPQVDCTVLIYQPHTFSRGWWRPKTTPNGWTTEDWFNYCSGRMRPKKKGPDTRPGPWGATVRLNLRNCSYTFDESWLYDNNGWKKAKIYVSPWRSG